MSKPRSEIVKSGVYRPMIQTMCAGSPRWANPTKERDMFRCTGCGQKHSGDNKIKAQ